MPLLKLIDDMNHLQVGGAGLRTHSVELFAYHQYMPLWRNWQPYLFQKQGSVGSTPTKGTEFNVGGFHVERAIRIPVPLSSVYRLRTSDLPSVLGKKKNRHWGNQLKTMNGLVMYVLYYQPVTYPYRLMLSRCP